MQHEAIKGEIESETQTMIVLKNRSEIHSLPGNNPDTIRGFSPTLLIIDEAAFVKDDVYVAAEPSLAATDGELLLVSTPFGKRGRFYQAFQEEEFEKYHVRSEENPLITKEFLKGMRGSKTEIEYKQEFEGEFIEEQDTYFPHELIMKCIQEYEIPEQPRDLRNYYLGVDLARYGLDESVYIIIEADPQHNARVIFIGSTSKKPLTDAIGRIKELSKTWPFRAIYVDESGMGAGAIDSLKEAGINIRNLQGEIGGIQFTLENKEAIYKNLKGMMEKGKLIFQKHDKLIHQLAEMQYEYTEAGHLKLSHPQQGHDDFPDALALACAGLIRREYKPYISTR